MAHISEHLKHMELMHAIDPRQRTFNGTAQWR